MPTYPHGSRFHPTELGLVKLHLKNKVDDNISGFIKTLNVYGDAPWLLDHDTNPLFCRNEWYYFVPRTIRGVKTVSRMVPGNGDSFLGGTWKSIGKRKEIKNRAKELKGYKRELVFNKNVVGKSEKEKTDWHMDEYSLHKNGDEFHDLVLCHVRLLNTAEIFKPVVPAAHQVDHENNDNNILQNQDQKEAGDANQQQQQQEQEDLRIPLHPPLQSNYNNQGRQYLLEASVYQNDMMIPENDRGYLNQQQQDLEDAFIPAHHSLQINNNLVPSPFDDNAYHGAEDDMTGYVLMPTFYNDVNQQQYELQQYSSTLLFQSNYNQRQYLLEDVVYQNGTMILKNDPGYLHQHQQQQQQEQEDSHIQFYDLADRTELMPNYNECNNVNQQHEQQQDSPTLFVDPLQSNDKQEHYPQGDIAFDATDDGLTFDPDEFLRTLDEEKEQQDQEQLQKDLQSSLLVPSWDGFGFDDADWLMQNMDECMEQRLQELVEELSKLLQPVPGAQDCGVHADQVMPKD